MAHFVSASELASELGVSTRTLTRLIRRGTIPTPPTHSWHGRRRWPVAVAVQALEAAGFVVPDSWRKSDQVLELGVELPTVVEVKR